MIEGFALILSVVAFIVAIRASRSEANMTAGVEDLRDELRRIRARIEGLVARVDLLERAAGLRPASSRPPATPSQVGAKGPVPAAPPVVATTPAMVPSAPAVPPPVAPTLPPAPPPAAPARLLVPPPMPQPASAPVGRGAGSTRVASTADPGRGLIGAAPVETPDLLEKLRAKTLTEGWERRLGILATVWVGAIAIALAGAFLVKYSVERGLLGPPARVAIAMIVGVALLGAGQWLLKRSPVTARGASASGIAVLYAGLLAGAVLYRLIPPWVGFVLLALVTAVAVVLSLRQGMVVAAVGLVGGFFTPFWIGEVKASAGPLFGYLLMLQVALLVVTRKRNWNGLSALTLVAGLAAAMSRPLAGTGAADAAWVGGFLLLSAFAFVIAARGWTAALSFRLADEPKLLPMRLVLVFASVLGAAGILSALAVQTRFGLLEWAFLGLLAVGSLVLGWLERTYCRLPWVVLAIVICLMVGWIAGGSASDRPQVWVVSAGLFAVFGVGGWLLHERSATTAGWEWLAALGGLLAFGFAYVVDRRHGLSVAHWGAVSLALGVPYVGAAVRAVRRRAPKADSLSAFAAFAVAATTLISLTVPLELKHEWLAVAWAIEVAALAWLHARVRQPVLARLGAMVAVLVAVRLLLNPAVLSYPLGTTPVLNWILYGYGIPVLAFAVAAVLYWRADCRRLATGLAWAAAALTFTLLGLEVRHGFHPLGLVGPLPGLIEWGTYALAWLLAGLACLLLWRRTHVELLHRIGTAFVGVGGAAVAYGPLLFANPLWVPVHVGAVPVANWLVYVLALPAALMALASAIYARAGRERDSMVAAWAAAFFAFGWLTMAVRHGFHPPALRGEWPQLVEWATYSHVWLAAALILLLAFRAWGVTIVRFLALAFLGVAAAKLILVDLLFASPLVSQQLMGTLPLLNWLLYVYAVPILAFLALAPAAGPNGDPRGDLRTVGHAMAAVFGFALVSLQVRQFFHPAGMEASNGATLVEIATYTVAWFALVAVLVFFWKRWGSEPAGLGASVLYAVTVGKLMLVDVLICNPLWWHQPVGPWPIVNALLYSFGAPIVLLVLTARLPMRGPLSAMTRKISLYGGLFLGLLLVSLQVRQAFHGTYLDTGALSNAENYSYSAAWLLFAFFVLAAGIARGGKVLRIASLVVVFLTVCKVFLYDLRHLQDLYRVLSFFGLGVSLLLISFLYQRFVFRGGERGKG